MRRVNKTFLIIAIVLCFLALNCMFLPAFTGEKTVNGFGTAFGHFDEYKPDAYSFPQTVRYIKESPIIIVQYALIFVVMVLLALSYFVDRMFLRIIHIILTVVLLIIATSFIFESIFVIPGEALETIALHEETYQSDYTITAFRIFKQIYTDIGFGRIITMVLLYISAIMTFITAISNKKNNDEDYYNSLNS